MKVSIDPIDEAVRLHSWAMEQLQGGEFDQASHALLESLRLFEENGGSFQPDVVNVFCGLSHVAGGQCRWPDAEASANRALSLLDALASQLDAADERVLRLEALDLLGNALREQGRYPDAQRALLRALEFSEQPPAQAADIARASNSLGILYKYTANFDEAERLYGRALALIEFELHSESLKATLYHNLGGLEHARGRFDRGLEPARRAYEIRRKLCGECHPATAADAAALAGILDGLERYSESRPLYDHALKIFAAYYGPEHYEIAVNLNNLANVEYAEGNGSEAETLYRRALSIKQRLLGSAHPDAGLTEYNLALLLEARGEIAQAKTLLASALRSFEESLGEEHPHATLCREALNRVSVL